MKRITIDINCDVGEGVGNESELLSHVSSCNIACGGHAGDEESMEKVIEIALKNKVRIGAHPAYPDRENFGRKSIDLPEAMLINSIQEQVQTLARLVKKKGGELHHIKPHGALYNDLAKDEAIARTFLTAISNYKAQALFVPDGSVIAKLAREKGFRVIYEVFADRNYNDDLSLVSRTLDRAVIHEATAVLAHVSTMVLNGKVQTINDLLKPINAETVCVHGDTPAAMEIIKVLSEQLPKLNISIHGS